MKLPYALFGVLSPPLTFIAHRIVVGTRCMGLHGKSREILESNPSILCEPGAQSSILCPASTGAFNLWV
jgi:hypothetical protein